MLRQTLALMSKELQIISRDRQSLFVLFLLPLLLATVIGGPSTLGQRAAETATEDKPALQVQVLLANLDEGAYGAEVVQALRGVNVLQIEDVASAEEADAAVSQGKQAAAIVVPAGFSDRIDSGDRTQVEVLYDPAQQEAAGIVKGIVNQAVSEIGLVAELRYGIHQVLLDDPAARGASNEELQAAEARTLGAIWTQVQRMRHEPTIRFSAEDLAGMPERGSAGPMDWYIAGFSVMFAFFMVSSVARAMLREREQGTFRRLLAAPLPRAAIIAGTMLAFTVLVLIQVLFLFAVGRLAFKINLGDSLLGLGLTMLATALASTGLGLLVGTLSRTSEQADSMGTMLGFVLAIVGGFPIPWFKFGGVMQIVSNLTPHAHAIQAMQGLTVDTYPLLQVMPHILAVFGFAALFFAVALWRYRFE